MEQAETKQQRPTAITVICVIGFLGAVICIPLMFSDVAAQIGAWYPPYLAFSTIVGFSCMVGFWMMKKWATYTYTAFVGVNQVVLLAMGVWNIMAILIPAIVVFFAFKHLKEMT